MHQKICLFLFLILGCLPGYSWEFLDRSGEPVQLELCSQKDLIECEEVFVQAFTEAYKDFSLEQLGIQDKLVFLHEAFADVYDDVQLGLQKLVVAKKEGKIIGFSGFKKTEKPNQIYISQLAIDPEHWKQGIGRQLVFSVFYLYENVESLVVIPRRINTVARGFYQKIGFSESSYMHPGYNPEKYMGYEWTLKK
jgi:ribosomal protein S18 acetylase RimI-like enzyme